VPERKYTLLEEPFSRLQKAHNVYRASMKSNSHLASITGRLGLFVLTVALGLLVFVVLSNYSPLLSREIDPYARGGVTVSLLARWVWGK
jgi:hypothetical protein